MKHLTIMNYIEKALNNIVIVLMLFGSIKANCQEIICGETCCTETLLVDSNISNRMPQDSLLKITFKLPENHMKKCKGHEIPNEKHLGWEYQYLFPSDDATFWFCHIGEVSMISFLNVHKVDILYDSIDYKIQIEYHRQNEKEYVVYKKVYANLLVSIGFLSSEKDIENYECLLQYVNVEQVCR